ncbi:hypothetical protein [Flavobacterium sp. WC2430]|uniref:hypothetical protein n=1 Tax=Flavobacterium sp. WC2430 TaxID=3234137 RepID=UPI003467E048
MNILTISTLYNKGGAAYIAKTLHSGLKEEGFNSKYLVGYGKRGLKENLIDKDFIFSRYIFPIIPHINLFFHKIIGKDLFSPLKKQLTKQIQSADVVICHTLHSYFINFDFLFKIFREEGKNKKIIMVAHDSWHYTGRCAFIYDCDIWKKGCEKCPNLNYYPSSLFSIAANERKNKINALSCIPNLIFVSPAQWICNDLKVVYPNHTIKVIRNAIETSPFENITRNYQIRNTIQICVSAVDLSQPGKIDLVLIESLLSSGVQIHFIGKNNPFKEHGNAIDHGYVSDREKYIDILTKVDCYLFSSSIDIYPTVLVDALCVGNFVFYTKSKGALEIMEAENSWLGKRIQNSLEIVDALSSGNFIDIIKNEDLREVKRNSALSFYNKTRMVEEYTKLFNN